MVDKYSKKMTRDMDTSTLWSDLRILEEAITAAHNHTGGWWGHPWSLRSDGRKWERATLNELREIAEEHALESFHVSWLHSVGDNQWGIGATVYKKDSGDIEAEVYGGSDRMETERVFKAVADEVRGWGLEMTREETHISSTDTGPDAPDQWPRTQSSEPASSEPTVRVQPGRIARFRAAIAPHLAAYIVGVAVLLTAIYLAVQFGLRA